MCEMKISPAILVIKKCHSHWQFLASKCEWAASHPCGDGWGAEGMQEARWKRKQDGPQRAEVHMKGMNSESPRLASSHTQNAKYLKLTPDLWCSDCQLPLLQTCILPDVPPASLEQFSQSYWDSASRVWSPKPSHQIK